MHSVCSWDDPVGLRYRYWLEARLPGGPAGVCLFLMLNPNKADHDRSDETIDRCKRLAQECGYGTLWVGNLFPVRGGNSNALPRDRMGPHQPTGGFGGCPLCRNDARNDLHVNDRHIRKAAENAGIIVCAWGGKGGVSGRGREVVRMLIGEGHKDRLYTFGLTKVEQQPRHAKPQLRGQWPKPEDLRPWSGVEQWLTESGNR